MTVIRRHIRDHAEVRAHRVAALDLRDVRIKDGLPVTAPARTLIDGAAAQDDDELARAMAEARIRRLVSDRELEAAMGRAPLPQRGSASAGGDDERHGFGADALEGRAPPAGAHR